MDVRNIVVTGKSGAGKQPRIDVLLREFGLKQLSTGNICRHFQSVFAPIRDRVDAAALWRDGGFVPDAEIRAAVEGPAGGAGIAIDAAILGFKASQVIERGLFGPDDVINTLVGEAIRAGAVSCSTGSRGRLRRRSSS